MHHSMAQETDLHSNQLEELSQIILENEHKIMLSNNCPHIEMFNETLKTFKDICSRAADRMEMSTINNLLNYSLNKIGAGGYCNQDVMNEVSFKMNEFIIKHNNAKHKDFGVTSVLQNSAGSNRQYLQKKPEYRNPHAHDPNIRPIGSSNFRFPIPNIPRPLRKQMIPRPSGPRILNPNMLPRLPNVPMNPRYPNALPSNEIRPLLQDGPEPSQEDRNDMNGIPAPNGLANNNDNTTSTSPATDIIVNTNNNIIVDSHDPSKKPFEEHSKNAFEIKIDPTNKKETRRPRSTALTEEH